MNWISSKEKLVGLTQRDADLIRIGLMYIEQYGKHGLGHLIEKERAELDPFDKKEENHVKGHAKFLIARLEDMLYEFEYVDKKENNV